MNKKFQRNVLLLSLVSFLNDMSSEMILPILPMFIVSLGGSSLWVGLIGGLRESIGSILKVFSGYFSDKTGKRKPFVFSGYSISSVFKLLLTFSKNSFHILVFSSFERLGKGLRTAPRDAILAESLPKERGKAFGVHRAFDTLGAIFGSVLVLFLLWLFVLEFQTIIFLSALIGFCSLIPLWLVKEKRTKFKTRTRIKTLPKPLKKFLLVSGIFSLGNFSYMFFLLKSQEFFPLVWMPVVLYVVYNVFYSSLSIPFGKLSDRISRKYIIGLGYLLFSLTCFGFVFANSFSFFLLLFSLYGIVYAMIDGNQRALVSDLSKFHGTGLGAFHTVTGLLALPASLIAGFLYQVNPTLTFVYGGFLGLLAGLLLFRLSTN